MSAQQSPPFTLFPKFPPEIQLEILKQCTRNDLVCLSVTCHDFRTFTTPLITDKPKLEWVDQLGSMDDVPHACLVDESDRDYRPGCKGPYDKDLLCNPFMHRHKRHTFRGRRPICRKCEFYPENHPSCSVPFCKKHCLCISCPLFIRLRGWMGKRRYCGECRKFTNRLKKNNGRCKYIASSAPYVADTYES